jgi:hypothetical protein
VQDVFSELLLMMCGCEQKLPLLEIARLLVRFDRVVRRIVNANQSIRVQSYPLRGRLAIIRLELLICEWALPSLVPAYE